MSSGLKVSQSVSQPISDTVRQRVSQRYEPAVSQSVSQSVIQSVRQAGSDVGMHAVNQSVNEYIDFFKSSLCSHNCSPSYATEEHHSCEHKLNRNSFNMATYSLGFLKWPHRGIQNYLLQSRKYGRNTERQRFVADCNRRRETFI